MQTTYIYDLAGRVISEYEAPTAVSLLTPPEPVGWCPGSVKYNLVDHLGSPRVVTDQAGAVVERRDYYPFGGEITATTNNQLKFTGKKTLRSLAPSIVLPMLLNTRGGYLREYE